MAQDSTPRRTSTQWYRYHVSQASLYEAKANKRREDVISRLQKTNPAATGEWYDLEAGKDLYFKAYVATQQFHVRQATMYGQGAILDVLGGLVAELRAFGHRP